MQTTEGTRDSVPRGFCLAHSKILRLLEEKQVLSIKHIICNFGTVSHSYLGMVGTLPKSKFSDASHGSSLQADLSKDSSLEPVCFLHQKS